MNTMKKLPECLGCKYGFVIAAFCEEAGFYSIDMKEKHVFSLETLNRSDKSPPHNDPFDRMLVAQAKAEDMYFITHDSLIPYYNEKCIVKV